MRHYTNKKTLEIYGYESVEDAQAFNEDFDNLVEMSDELFQEYRKQTLGGKWSLNGWVIDEALAKQLKREQLLSESKQLISEKKDAEADIKNGETLEDDELIRESTEQLEKILLRIDEIKSELKAL